MGHRHVTALVGALLLTSLPAHASISAFIDCQRSRFADNYWVVSSDKGSAVLNEIAELLKKSPGFKVVEKFDYVVANESLKHIPFDGMVISTSSTNAADTQNVLGKIESFMGVDVGCVSKDSFDQNGKFLGF